MNLSIRSDSDIVPIDPSEVPFAVMAINTDQYFQVAVVATLAYDAAITMDKEVKYFWTPSRRLVNIVYFLNRYTGLLGPVALVLFDTYSSTINLCLFSLWTRLVTNLIVVISVDYVLMIRVIALYAQDTTLSTVLKVLLCVEAVLKLVATIYIGKSDEIGVASLANALVCYEGGVPGIKWAFLDWVVPMVFGLILMVLAVYKAAQYWKDAAGLEGVPLVKILIRDQVIYFAFTVFCCAMNIAQYRLEVSNNILAGVLQALGNPSFLCVMGSRMLFNLKEASELGVNEGTSYRMKTVSEMQFA